MAHVLIGIAWVTGIMGAVGLWTGLLLLADAGTRENKATQG